MPAESIRLLIVDDEHSFRTGLGQRLARKGMTTFIAGGGREAMVIAQQNLLDVALVDIRMPEMTGIELLAKLKEAHPSIEVLILTGVGSVDTAIEAMKLGAYDYLSKPFRFEELCIQIEKAYEKKRIREQNVLLRKELRRTTATTDFIGASPKAMEIRSFIAQAAEADCPVLLEGESGSGKEVIAREIHKKSARGNAPFVVLDCGGFPETLLADELFGHERGAFTTAVDSRQGLLEMADGGTLLIDEIGEMTPTNQVALLRVVETNSFRRLGGSKELLVNVRILASTNRNLRNEVASRRFRQDLFYRLEVLHFLTPPLRDRKDDIPLLADHFLARLNQARGTTKRLSPEQKDFLKYHHWPGNVRELANLIERAFFLSFDEEIDLVEFLQTAPGLSPENQNHKPKLEHTLSDIEREHVLRMLAAKGGNKKETAKALGISRSRLYNLLTKYGVSDSPPT
jgi:two-component system response regulator AtoC